MRILISMFLFISLIACRRTPNQSSMITKACSYKTVPLGVVFYDTSYRNEAHTCLDNELDLAHFTTLRDYGVVKPFDAENGLYTYDEFAPFKYVIGAKNSKLTSVYGHEFTFEFDQANDNMTLYIVKKRADGTFTHDYGLKVKFNRLATIDVINTSHIDYFRNHFVYKSIDYSFVNATNLNQTYSGTADVQIGYLTNIEIKFYNARNNNEYLFKKSVFGSDKDVLLRFTEITYQMISTVTPTFRNFFINTGME